MPFEIIQHPGDAIVDVLPIIEVIYPAHPTDEDIAAYDRRAREIVDAQRRRPFCVLADQRALRVMAPDLVTMVGALNAYASARGMLRTARVVATAVAGLQAQRMARESGFELGAFESRDDALAWLRESGLRTPT
jgi:hypothetical protein